MNRKSEMRMGRYLSLLFLCTMLLSSCQNNTTKDGVRRLRMAHVYKVTTPPHKFGTEFLAERIREETDDLEITVYPAEQLGSESELLEQLVAGELDLAITGPSFLAMWHPPIGVFDAAYSSRDLDHMLELAKSDEIKPEWETIREKYGVRVLDTWAYGSRHITSNKPIRHPEDLKGFRLRMPNARIWQASGEALGGSPMPVSFSEVYIALQQGIADGQENPVPVIQSMGFHEVQKYLNLTGHIQSSVQIVVNEKTWQSLSKKQQDALLKTLNKLGGEVYRGLVEKEKKLIEEWRKSGEMEIVEGVDVDAFRERCKEYFAEGFKFSELYNRISSEPSNKESQ